MANFMHCGLEKKTAILVVLCLEILQVQHQAAVEPSFGNAQYSAGARGHLRVNRAHVTHGDGHSARGTFDELNTQVSTIKLKDFTDPLFLRLGNRIAQHITQRIPTIFNLKIIVGSRDSIGAVRT